MKKYEVNIKQLALSVVKEDGEKHVPRKRVDIVSLRLVKEKSLMYKYRAIRSPEDAYELFKQFLGDLDREYFVVMALDVKNQPTAINICHIGSLNASIVHPRAVLKTAILSNAVSILVFHNYPSGQPEPSREDIEVTKRLAKACDLMNIYLLVHLVMVDESFVSMKEKGYML